MKLYGLAATLFFGGFEVEGIEMNAQRMQHIWKLFGKIVRLSEIGLAQASGVKEHLVATTNQLAAQGSGEPQYDDLISVVVPMHGRVRPTVTAMERFDQIAKGTIQIYLNVLGTEFGLPTGSSVTTQLDKLRDEMVTYGNAITPSGKFYDYFNDNFGYTSFPTHPTTPDVQDAWVTTVIV